MADRLRVERRGGAGGRSVAAEGRAAAERIDELLARLCRQLGPAAAETLMLHALYGARVRPGFWSPSACLHNLRRLAGALDHDRAPSSAPPRAVVRSRRPAGR